MGTPVHTETREDQRKGVRLRVTATSPSAGRRWFRATINGVEPAVAPDKIDDMELILSELLTNVIRHTRSRHCWILVAWSESQITFGVSDESPRKKPKIVCHAEDDEGGRGLDLVTALAAQWGFFVCREGWLKVVWAQVGRSGEDAAVSREVPRQLQR